MRAIGILLLLEAATPLEDLRETMGRERRKWNSYFRRRARRFAADRSIWERKHGAFPGREDGGVELNCTMALHDMDHERAARSKFVDYWLNWLAGMEAIDGAARSDALRGLEIGACGMPVRVDRPRVTIQYLDNNGAQSNDHCFVRELVKVHIVDDAQEMRRVEPGTYDFAMGFHVLEHLGDFFGALRAWVRSVRVGGLVMFALPSPCDTSFLLGESLRLVTDPSHYLREFGRHDRVAHNANEHLRESAVAMWGLDEQHPLVQKAMGADHKARVEKCARTYRKAKRAWNVSDTPPALWTELPHGAMQPRHLECVVEHVLRVDPNRAHLHVWTLHSLRRALELAQAAMPADVRFEVVSALVAPKAAFSMEELRVVLRRRRN